MKYVRLKDGTICDDGDNYRIDEEGNYCEIETFMNRSEEVIMMPKENIEKESDNIEDLLDLYVIQTDDNYHIMHKVETLKTHNFTKQQTCFGAIWIKNKGLMYVAKMNKDERWELI